MLGNADVWPTGSWHSDSEDGILEMRAVLTSGEGRSFELQGSGEQVEVCDDDWCNDKRNCVNWDDESVERSLLFLSCFVFGYTGNIEAYLRNLGAKFGEQPRIEA